MKIGYPCINRSLSCQANKTFRLKSYSERRFIQTVENNLNCLQQILQFNRDHHLLFFRISSDIIPFASHPVLTVDWMNKFKELFNTIGETIKSYDMRISMHPDQFIVLNSKKEKVVQRSIEELIYHADVFKSLLLDTSAKIQLHVGGVYGDKKQSINRFIDQFHRLPESVKKHLVIENDDRNYSVHDCLEISSQCQIPVLFDVFHHQLNNNGESFQAVLKEIKRTWKESDGIPMIDYSSQEKGEKRGKHTTHINDDDFTQFLYNTRSIDADVMLEIKDKEQSANKAVCLAQSDSRFIRSSHL